MTLIELSEFVREFGDTINVTAAAPVVVAPAASSGAGEDGGTSESSVSLCSLGRSAREGFR